MKLREIFSAKQLGSLLTSAKGEHQARYASFRALLNHNRAALRAMAELEQIYYSDHPVDARTVRQHHEDLVEHVHGLATALNDLTEDRFSDLPEACHAIEARIAKELAPRRQGSDVAPILALAEIGPDQLPAVGGKAFNLAVLKNLLKLPVPEGFVMTTAATEHFLADGDLKDRIREELAQLSPKDIGALEAGSARIRQIVMDKPVPADLAAAITAAYAELEGRTCPGVRIAVRSSAVGEDGESSFAGQYSTVLNVTRAGLLDAFKRVVASKYSPRAISYRQLLGLDDEDTPMCVIGLAMIDAQASGVMYTLDPATGNAAQVKIGSLWGLGEQLVDGDATPDAFLVDKDSGMIVERHIASKAARLIALPGGGTRLEEMLADQQARPSLSDETLHQLCAGAQRIEAHYRSAQDIEWAIDAGERLYFLQARPLRIEPAAVAEPEVDLSGLDPLLHTGIAASRGIAAGRVFIAHNAKRLADIPDHAILVTPTASPAFAAIMGRIDALITDAGSITSHLASVAREFGIPAIMAARNATTLLPPGETVTVVAESRVGVVRGVVDALRERMRPAKKRYVDSPAHRKLRALLDHVAPLNLTDSRAPDFSVAGCRTFHDVIRLCHEHAMRAMFDLSSAAAGAGATVKVVTHLPLAVYLIDLGGGLREASSDRRSVAPADFASLPLQAIWQGMTHPGVSWEGTVNFASSRFMSIMATIATSELGPEPGGDSYVLVSHDYMNFSAKFGYHFATVDALCVADASHNYVSLQFAGGAGNFFGRSLRIRFLGAVLERLGFEVALQGDLIEATFSRHELAATQDRLDQLGRLLASCRLLDMTLANEEAVDTLVAAFMAGDYDLLKPRDAAQPDNFYIQQGHWSRQTRDDRICLYQSGRTSARPVSGALSGLIGKTIGASYQELLDSIGAYLYFPLAIAKNSEMADGGVAVELMPEGGIIDRAGGIIFGLKNAANYFVFRINALEHNAILFEFVNGKRSERGRAALVVRSGCWYRLRAEIADRTICCSVDGQMLVEYHAEIPIRGHVGVWTKADSATWFRPLCVDSAEGTRVLTY
ncbi:MAG TPA: pyruvate, phosphate dikinase [Gammaproteobacteria bacterium]|nr:pyruvate, phosphate dikinase [Gammaproteobacteria bacterium]